MIGIGLLISKWRRGSGKDEKPRSQTAAAAEFRENGVNWTAGRVGQIENGDMKKPSDKQIEAIAKTTGYDRSICYFYSNAIPPELRPASADYESMLKVQTALSMLYEFFGCQNAGPPRPSGTEKRYGFVFEPTDPLEVTPHKVRDKPGWLDPPTTPVEAPPEAKPEALPEDLTRIFG